MRLWLKSLRADPLQLLRHRSDHTCPICEFTGRFWSFGSPPRPHARCPQCFSVERHRLVHLCLLDLGYEGLADKRILHFAPEPWLWKRLSPYAGYITADYAMEGVMIHFDIGAIPFPAGRFDFIVANHVLEHIPDDRRAMEEIRRVLSPGGMALLTVPLIAGYEQTYEDPTIITEDARLAHFGQEDHVRFYGRDFSQRLEAAGLGVSTYQASPGEEIRFGLHRGTKVYLVRPDT